METFVVLVLVAITGTISAQDLFELNIIHYNDFHAHFDEVSPVGTPCNPDGDPCIGGIARLHTAINQALELEPESLLLNGGDSFQGTLWYNLMRWNVTAYFMNQLPKHDALYRSSIGISTYTLFQVLGNHEFDHGIEGLVPYLEHLNSVMLGANVNADLEPSMQGLFQSHVVVERKGRKIGIIGVLLTQFSAPIGELIISDELEAVNREARLLTQQGVDIIVLLSHCGLTCDRALARSVDPTVDVIVGGHSHTLLYNGDTPNGDNAAGTYPVYVTQTDTQHTIPIVQASAYTRYLGNVKLYFDDAGHMVKAEGQPIFLGTSIVQDPLMLSLLAPWREEVDAYGKEVLGHSRVTLSRSCRSAECNMGSWACDGFLQQTMAMASPGSWAHAHVCLLNNGGLRTHLEAGDITTEGLLMALPFENRIQTYDLQGKYLLEALEFSVSGNINPNDFSSGRMLQYGGIRVVFNTTAPSGSRVHSALVRCIECDVPRFEPLVEERMYRVLTQNYIGDGGGGYTMLSEHRSNVLELEVDYVMLQRWVRYEKTIIQGLDERVLFVS